MQWDSENIILRVLSHSVQQILSAKGAGGSDGNNISTPGC